MLGQRRLGAGARQATRLSEACAKLYEKSEEMHRASQSGLETLKARVDAGLSQLESHARNVLDKADSLSGQTRTSTDLLVQKAVGWGGALGRRGRGLGLR